MLPLCSVIPELWGEENGHQMFQIPPSQNRCYPLVFMQLPSWRALPLTPSKLHPSLLPGERTGLEDIVSELITFSYTGHKAVKSLSSSSKSVCVYLFLCVSVCMYMCMCGVYTCMCMCICMVCYVCMCMCVYMTCVCACMCVSVYVCICVSVWSVYVSVCVCMLCLCVCVFMCLFGWHMSGYVHV